MKRILILIFTTVLCLTSCNWTDYDNIDFTKDHKSFKEIDPDGYKAYLKDVKAYKETDHLLMIAGVEGVKEKPRKQSEHLTSLPDSIDYVMIKDMVGLHKDILAEIKDIEEKKGIRTLGLVDFDAIKASWDNIRDKRTEEGKEPGNEKQMREYIKNETQKLLDTVEENELHGIVFSAIGEGNDAFWNSIDNWKMSHEDKIIAFRGIPSLVPDRLMAKCKYIIILSNENASVGTLHGAVNRLIRNCPVKDRVMIEVTVPSADKPKQEGATPQVAAEFVVTKQNERKYKPLGVVVNNADSDYYNSDMIYCNVRKAVDILSVKSQKEEK